MKEFLDYLAEFAGPLVALFGIILSYPLFKRKLTANHISWRLEKIQSSNFKLHLLVQKLKDKYFPQVHLHKRIEKNDLIEIQNNIKDAYFLSLEGSSDVATLLYYLKSTIENAIRYFDREENSSLYTNSFFVFFLNNLELVNYYSNQVIQIPKSSKTERKKFVVKPLHRFVTNSETVKYKHFKTGVIYDHNSAHYTMFYSKVNQTHCPFLIRSAFQIHTNPKPVANLLYLKEIYAPLTLEKPVENSLFGPETYTLYLIGFIFWTRHQSSSSEVIEECDLIYSNLNDNFQFVQALVNGKITLSDFKDTYLPNSSLNLPEVKKEICATETFKIRVNKKLLLQNFKKNKKEFKKQLKITVYNKGG
ncbi:hypothetical protein [Salinimicrobium oceani]|uniref:Uncharacterized protein n=1 Tax=Salinimicrobium oceani TaxID=2722702 RepID=A0ABX1D3P8_9FLAO|nr:hypothetical protein [Salinimicrobium oceani]NJW53566.1 hypothetical protein [Salinimicrobium oceani]